MTLKERAEAIAQSWFKYKGNNPWAGPDVLAALIEAALQTEGEKRETTEECK